MMFRGVLKQFEITFVQLFKMVVHKCDFLGAPRNMPHKNLDVSNQAQKVDFSPSIDKFDMFLWGGGNPETILVNQLSNMFHKCCFSIHICMNV